MFLKYFIFQETHSSFESEKQSPDEFNDNLYFFKLETEIDGTEYLLVNLYNANTESEQLQTLKTLSDMLNKFNHFRDKNVIIAGDVNPFFNSKLK